MTKPDYEKLIEDEKIVGGYNSFPPNMKKVTMKEFVQSKFFHWDAKKSDWRQVTEKHPIFNPKGGFFHLMIFWYYDGTYVAMHDDFWAGTIDYYNGCICEHDNEAVTIGRCLTRYTCKKCGFVEEVDSSD